MAEERGGQRKKSTKVESAKVTYVRSNFCRVIRVDGAYGGITPQGIIHLGVYVERTAEPTFSTFLLDNELKTATEQLPSRGPGWVREIEADILLTKEAATAIRNWLDDRLKQISEIQGEQFATLNQRETP